jgi:TonB family protein
MSLSVADFKEEALGEASAPEAPSPAERLSGPEAQTPDDRKGWAIALIAAAALHLIIPLALIAYYMFWPPPAVPIAAQEIPVEVVVEPPPPPPKKAEDQPKPPPQPDDEKPAYDAPAPATEEKVNRESPDKTTEAPTTATAPSPTPGAPPKTDAQTPPPPHDLTPTPEGEEPADLNPATDENTADASEAAAPAPQAKAPVGAPLPTIEELPQYKFARATKDSPIATGNADSRYFTIVYGMIRSHYREPSAARPIREGAIVFGVDETGNLVGRKLVSSCGSPNLDMAVMAAIAEAAPYPAPPNWQPRTMRLTYGH